MREIMERTSVRKYLEKPLSEAEVQKILRAGFSAPSARNLQPWEFLVVQKPEMLEKMATLTPYSGMLAKAAMGMVVCGNTERNPSLDYCQQDCAAATENMLLEAKHLGIGSCWIGVYPNEDRVDAVRACFDLPKQIVPLWMVSFGYPAEKTAAKDKWDVAKVHREAY